jgi:ribose transport system substrate-binding protein
MKNLLTGIIILTLLFGFVFLSLPSRDLNKNSTRVAILIPGSVEFFSVQKQGLNQAAEKFGLQIIYADAEWDAGKQLSQVENFISMKVDLILLCSVDNLALLRAAPLAQKAGIPLMTFSNTIGGHPQGKHHGVIAHIGRNEEKSGEMLAQMLEKIFGKKAIKILLIQGSPGTSAQRMREKGFSRIARQHKNWEIVSNSYVTGWTKEGALNSVEDFLQTGKKADVIVTQWWTASIAAAMALKEKDVHGIKVIGLEFSKGLVPYLESGEVEISTYFSIKEEGFKAVETAGLYLKKREVPNFIEIIPTWVTGKNLSQFEPEL